jgi:hypothetical protein
MRGGGLNIYSPTLVLLVNDHQRAFDDRCVDEDVLPQALTKAHSLFPHISHYLPYWLFK